MAVLSTLRSTDQPLSLDILDDDSLLHLLKYFSVPELFQLRAVSRRVSYLIERYRLPQYRTLIYGYDKAKEEEGEREGQEETPDRVRTCIENPHGPWTVQVYFTTQAHAYSAFCKRLGLPKDNCERTLPTRKLATLHLHTLPPSLPNLLPQLSCLTFTYYLEDQEEDLTEEQLTVNRLAVAYLSSHWSTNLVSLHLYIEIPDKPQPDNAFFSQLNSIISLRHLYLEFSQFLQVSTFLLPNSMPIFTQLTSFSLHFYSASNIAALLAQLSPGLTYLSLWEVNFSVAEYGAFLDATPIYRHSLKTLEIGLPNTTSWQVFTRTVQCFTALERLFAKAYMFAQDDLLPVFTQLSAQLHLREFFIVSISLRQLDAFRLRHPQSRTWPRLSTIRQATFLLYNNVSDHSAGPEVLTQFSTHYLPIFAHVFGGLEHVDLHFAPCPETGNVLDEPLSQQLARQMKEHFPALRHCKAKYFVIPN